MAIKKYLIEVEIDTETQSFGDLEVALNKILWNGIGFY